jgi:serine/threonine protein kinase
MATNLDLLSGPNTIFASVYSDDEWSTKSLLGCESNSVPNQSLQSLCEDAAEALERALSLRVGQDDWRELLRVARSISGILPPNKRLEIVNLSASDDSCLTLRLRSDLIAVPLELMHVGEERLLGEVFDVGRQIVAPSDEGIVVPRDTLKEPFRVLIIADSELNYALKEGQQLLTKLQSYGPRLSVELLSGVTKQDLLRELPYADILHFAGEAEADPQNPDKTGWRLSKDEWFDCQTIKNCGIGEWPMLIFANACRTAHIVRLPGDWGLDGMAFTLLKNGVRHYISTFARIPDSDIVVRFALCFYDALLNRATVGEALRHARRQISNDEHGQENLCGRMIAANYLHYGNPGGYLFESPQPTMAQNVGLETLIQGVIAQLQGRIDEAQEIFIGLKQEVREESVIKRLDGLLQEIERDKTHSQEVQARLKESTEYVHITPKRIGPYEIVKEIGHGMSRTVYWAKSFKQDAINPEVSIALPYNQHDDFIRRQREAFLQLQPKIQHPGLVQIYDVAGSDGIFYIVYELVQGSSLLERLSKDPAPWAIDKVGQIVEGIGLALDHAHKQGIFHGELSPRDIILSDNGEVKVLDVGQVAALRRAGLRYATTTESERYRAPEQWSLHIPSADSSSDVWALVVITYELLTGHHPFEHTVQNGDWGKAILESLPYPASMYKPDLPEGIAQVLWRALSRSLEDRYPSASEFVHALRQARQGTTRIGGFEPDIEVALETGAPLLYVQADDEIDALKRLQSIAAQLERRFYTWRLTWGITEGLNPEADSLGYIGDPLGALNWLSTLEAPAILVLLDYDIYIDDIPLAPDSDEHFRETPGSGSRNPPPDHDDTPWDHLDARAYSSAYQDRTDQHRRLIAFPKEQILQRLRDLATIRRKNNGIL